jgi:hypothetical protein
LTDNSLGGNILSPMERDTRLAEKMKSIKRRGGTPTLVDGKLVIDWPAQTESNTTPVGINKVASGTGKRIAHPRGG